MTSFATPCQSRLLEHVHPHLEVREPVPAGVRAVRADPAHFGGEVEDELGLRIVEQPGGVALVRQVVVGAAGDEGIVAARAEAVDEVRAEESAAPGDQDPCHCDELSQSTRPIHRSRFSAYQRIVCRTPSSQLTFGSQPVSRFSFS